ncbi:MAG: glycosyltransferase, partial [Pseudomonadota bacterium]|nr:glycosyltransferase [Pseudomonadota bacterium]
MNSGPDAPAPLRIALIAHLSEVSGAGTALLEVARGLDPGRFEATLILPGEGPLADRARSAGVAPVVVPNPEHSFGVVGAAGALRLLRDRAAYVFRLQRFLRRSRPDLVYVNSAVSVFAGVAARLAGLPVVWHVHETFDRPGPAARIKLALVERLSRAILYASASAEAAFPASRVALRLTPRNFVPVEEIAAALPAQDEEIAALGLAPASILIVASGLIRRKGADILLRSFADLNARRPGALALLIVGEAPPDSGGFARSLRDFATAQGLDGAVA